LGHFYNEGIFRIFYPFFDDVNFCKFEESPNPLKDNFSIQASVYSQFRPHYPDEMINYLVSLVQNRDEALDVGTGNGQVAAKLARTFKIVKAIDISTRQLENAARRDNIHYSIQQAEATDFGDHQFDLLTVAQAIHWFDFDKFYKEVYRILKPDGIFAILGYALCSTNPHSDEIIQKLYSGILGEYWHPERKYLDESYRTIPFPLDEISVPKFENKFTWTFEQLEGYFSSWSATQQYKDKNNADPLDFIREELKQSWEASDKQVTFPWLLRVGKLKK